jgi:hypothetical protein
VIWLEALAILVVAIPIAAAALLCVLGEDDA